MADLSLKEKLQPSLLDRLTDERPYDKDEPSSQRVISVTRLRALVRRDMSWLLNAGNLESLEDLEPYPAVRQSVLNFGMPDLSGLMVADLNQDDIERMVKTALLTFEPRILANTLRVRAQVSSEQMNPNAIMFEIEGRLWAQPMPSELFLKTEIDLETGHVEVRDAAQISGGS